MTKQIMRWFLGEMHRRYTLDNVLFLVDNAGHLDPILVEDGYRSKKFYTGIGIQSSVYSMK